MLLEGRNHQQPRGNVLDIEAVAKIAHGANVPLVIDNTFATPTCRPIDYGADIVVHSLTKFMGAYGTIERSWTAASSIGQKQARADQHASRAYHGMNFSEVFGAIASSFAAASKTA